MCLKKCLLPGVLCALAIMFSTDSALGQSKKKSEQGAHKISTERSKIKGTLFKALESALNNNREILSAEKDLEIACEGYVQASAAFRPRIEANAKYSGSDGDSWSSKVANTDEMPTKHDSRSSVKSAGIAVKYNLYHGYADMAAMKEVDAQVRARVSKFEALKQKIFRDVISYYFEINAKAQEILHLKVFLKARQGSLEVAQKMFKTGAAKYLDVAQSIAGCAEVEAKLAKANAEYVALSVKFVELTGFTLPATLDVPDQLFDSGMSLKQCIDLALKYNPNIIAASDNVAAAKEAVKKSLGKILPTVDLQYSFDQSVDHSSKNPAFDPRNINNHRGHTISVVATIPIYDAGVSTSERRQANDLVAKYGIELAKIIEETKTEVTSTRESQRASCEAITSAKRAVESRVGAVRDTEKEYLAGIKIGNDLLKAQQEEFEARSMLTQAKKERAVSQCSLWLLTGYMTDRKLGLRSQFNFEQVRNRARRRVV
jgi:outer membrane protein TolC